MFLHQLFFGVAMGVHRTAHLDQRDRFHTAADGDRRAFVLDIVRCRRDGLKA